MIGGLFLLFLIIGFRLVGGPPTSTTGRGPQAASYLCLYVKTASLYTIELRSEVGGIMQSGF